MQNYYVGKPENTMLTSIEMQRVRSSLGLLIACTK